MSTGNCSVVGVDVFCGAGGLTAGLQRAGIRVAAGVDLDPSCKFPYEKNNGSAFIEADIRRLSVRRLRSLYPKGAIKLLAGCAPCRPFSALTRGSRANRHADWGLLAEFQRLVCGMRPELVTMENVPSLASRKMFRSFVTGLITEGYWVDWRSIFCPEFGIPQQRRRLVLVASRLGPISVPVGKLAREDYRTVRQAIGGLRPIGAGQRDPRDRLHTAFSASKLTLQRLRASVQGGTWEDWPEALRADCHKKPSGKSYRSIYGRMAWDLPSPTITTQSHNFGTGRFGHPSQNRAISLREAAILQTFPRDYRFVAPQARIEFTSVGRLIGNAVPPKLAEVIGRALLDSLKAD